MTSSSFFTTTSGRLCLGLLAGVALAAAANFSSLGEVSSIVIVAILFFVTFAAGAAWGSRAWVPSAVAWSCVPLSHVVKHAFHLADTLQPNTYRSILLLAVFTGAIAAVGTGLGIALRRPGP
jgi:hypothetical protein